MASPSSHSHLRLLAPLPRDARARHVEADHANGGYGALRLLPPYRSDSRDIDTRESWGDVDEGNTSAERTKGVKWGNPDLHEPTANWIILVASLLMLAGAVWWGNRLQHHDLNDSPQRAVTPASDKERQRTPAPRAGQVSPGS